MIAGSTIHILLISSQKLAILSLCACFKRNVDVLYMKKYLDRNEYLHDTKLHVCASACMSQFVYLKFGCLRTLYAFLHRFKLVLFVHVC